MEERSLTNQDFRKLLFTPRPGAKPDNRRQQQQRQQQINNDKTESRIQKPKPRQYRPPYAAVDSTQVKDSVDMQALISEEPVYRDRAAERRKGLPIENNITQLGADVAQGIDYEDSKYLGGDIDHTHLVKGLDFALLNKVRSEQLQVQQSKQSEEGGRHQKPVSFTGPLGRAIYNILFLSVPADSKVKSTHTDVSERFLPKRTAFVYNINDSDDAFSVPTTLLRAKEDCPPPPKILEAQSDAIVIERLSKIISYMMIGDGGGGKKKVKKEKRQRMLAEAGLMPTLIPPPRKITNDQGDQGKDSIDVVKKPVDEDEDIFMDAGKDYVPECRKPLNSAQGAPLHATLGTSYFDKDKQHDDDDLPPIAQPRLIGTVGYGDDTTTKVSSERKTEREPGNISVKTIGSVDDGYAECYPEYQDMAGMVYDSEDDDGDGVAKPKSLAMAEGGPTLGGGELSKKEIARLAVKEKRKQESELAQLQKVFIEKGYGNESAFGGRGGRTTSKEALGQKRRRI